MSTAEDINKNLRPDIIVEDFDIEFDVSEDNYPGDLLEIIKKLNTLDFKETDTNLEKVRQHVLYDHMLSILKNKLKQLGHNEVFQDPAALDANMGKLNSIMKDMK